MKRAAIFVEGQTEAIFVKKLLQELAGAHAITFQEEKKSAGLYVLTSSISSGNHRIEVLIVNCCNDEQVLSSIKERYAGLELAGYSLVIGIRDLYPIPLSDLAKVLSAISTRMPTGSLRAQVVVAIHEVEAWFILDETHFARVDPSITRIKIISLTGYDPVSGSVESLSNPAKMLNEIYKAAGKSYKKTRKQIERTVEAIDYANLCLARRAYSPSMDSLMAELDAFIA